jgi:hypothetical protein
MPGISKTIPYTIPAAAVIANVLTGDPTEYWGKAGSLTLYGSCDVAGDTMSLSYYSGGDPGSALIPSGSLIPVASTAGTVKNNENFIGQFAIPAGSRLVLSVAGTAAHVGRFQIIS